MHDLPQQSWQPLSAAQDQLRSFFSLHNYKVLDTPILEPTELFLRKSGGEIAARMYTFFDPGGNQVSLRPEFTSSVLRNCLEGKAGTTLPIRIQYAGPVFRYEGDADSYRQFTQVGAELLGSASPRADAEILSLSYSSLTNLGVKGHSVELSDVGILHQLLSSLGLSERSVVFILSVVGDLKTSQSELGDVRNRMEQLRLISSEGENGDLGTRIRAMDDGEARELLHGLVQWAEVGSLGQREPLEVVERLLTKFRGSDDPGTLDRGIQLVSSLAQIRGKPEFSLKAAKDVIESYGLELEVLDRLTETLSLIDESQLPVEEIVVDFGLARDIAYYTGLIFEIKHPALPFSMAGGGRYDTLGKALGSEEGIPALGFAYTLEHLLEVLGSQKSSTEIQDQETSSVLVLPAANSYQQAHSIAWQLRNTGRHVEMDVHGLNLEGALEYARSSGIGEVLEVAEDGSTISHQVLASDSAPITKRPV